MRYVRRLAPARSDDSLRQAPSSGTPVPPARAPDRRLMHVPSSVRQVSGEGAGLAGGWSCWGGQAWLGFAVALVVFAACAESFPEPGLAPPVERPAPSGGTVPDERAAERIVDPAVEPPPDVVFLRPEDGALLGVEPVTVSLRASSRSSVAAVFVRSGPNTPRPARFTGEPGVFEVTLPAGSGPTVLEAWAVDAAGQRTEPPMRIRVVFPEAARGVTAPVVGLESPADGAENLEPLVLVRGRVDASAPIVSLTFARDGEPLEERAVATDDGFATFSRRVPLLPGVAHTVEVRAVDAAGREGRTAVRLQARPVASTAPPEVRIVSPEDGAQVAAPLLLLRGTTRDPDGIREVRVRVGTPAPLAEGEYRFGPWSAASSEDDFDTFSAELELPEGPARIEARAIDIAGVAASTAIEVENTWVSDYGPVRRIELRYRDDPRAELLFELDDAGIEEILPPHVQRQIRLASLDSTPLLVNLLERVRNACGTDWRRDHPDPRHDCTLTPLGQTFRGTDGTWRSSPEYALVRLLTMTPANAQVAGTSIAGLQELADGRFFGITIGGGFSQILADALGIERTDPIVSIDAAAAAFRDRFVASHPEVDADGTLVITLYDALRELSPLGDLLGPSGEHPGVFDPSFTPRAALKGPDFRLRLGARSNLRWLEGLRLGEGKDWLAIVDDPDLGPDGPVLSFDFFDESRFDFLGLIEEPTADLRFFVVENDRFIDSCSGRTACQDNLPGQPLDDDSLWATPPWEIEHVVGYAAWLQYSARRFSRCYIQFAGCQARVSVGAGDDPPGWARFDVLFNLGNPPRDQYLWELISEVAQVALHAFGDTVVAEGDLEVAFTIEDVPVGVTATELRETIRPVMQEQAGDIAELLLGNYRATNGDVDVLLRRGDDGALVLVHAHPDDPRPVDDDPWPNPGFFGHPDLGPAHRISSTTDQASGFPGRHVLRPRGETDTVWIADREGHPWRLDIDWRNADRSEVILHVARRQR